MPLGFAILLLLEAGIVTKNERFLRRVMTGAPLLLLLSVPMGGGPIFHGFSQDVTSRLGSPVWMTVWVLATYYAWATFRLAPRANVGLLSMLALLSVVGRSTVDVQTLVGPYEWPFFVVSALLFVQGLYHRSSAACTAAAMAATLGLWITLEPTSFGDYRYLISSHGLWLAVVILGLTFHDSFAGILRATGALSAPVAALAVMLMTPIAPVPNSWQLSYVVALTAAWVVILCLTRDRWYFISFALTGGVAGYAGMMLAYHRAADFIGHPAMTSFAWSIGTLLLAFLISAHKAHWLPPHLLPRWANGSSPGQLGSDEPPGVSQT